MTLLGITLGVGGVLAVGIVIGWHIPQPPWAKWFFSKLGWKAAA